MVGEVCVIAPSTRGQDVLRGCGDADIYSTVVIEREDSYDNCLLAQENICIEEEVHDEYAASIDSEITAEGEYESPEDEADEFLAVEDTNSTEVVFVREGVSVWPTRNESIKGRLSLIKQHCVLFLSWLPYNHNGALQDDGTFLLDGMDKEPPKDSPLPKDCSMYAIHPIPLSDIKAIRRHTPALGWHYIAVVLVSGLTLPPLYFNQGGVKAFFKSLKQHCFLAKSSDDPTTYLVNDISDPLQRSLTSLELTDILLGAPPLNASCTFVPEGGPGAHWAEPEQTWKGLTAFGDTLTRLTHQLRDTTSSWFAAGQWTPDDCPSLPELRSFPSEDVEVVERPQDSSNSSSSNAVNIRNLKRSRGGWRNGEPPADETEASTSVGSFELVGVMMEDDIAAARRRPRPPPLSGKEFGTFLDSEGRLVDVAGFRERVFYSGLSPELRREGWKFLLGVHAAGSTAVERNEMAAKRAVQYEELRQQWLTIGSKQAARFSKWRERKMRVDKDVRRTDRAHSFYAGDHNTNLRALRRVLLTYTMYNFDLGYCQGMSDLGAPLLFVSRDEGEAFWLYSALMDRMEGNFHVDQRGMHAQLLALRKLLQVLDPQLYSFLESKDCLNLFFCFRWVLIHFKREFGWDDVLRLWEAIWACPLTPHLHLYLCTAVLIHHRRSIMENDFEFDELLKFCIELSGHMDLDHLLRLAEALCRYAGEAGKECLAGLDDALNVQSL